MSRLNQELGLIQGIALLSTSLLGTGIFVVPALAATAAGPVSLWAWLILIALILPMAFTFAQLGRAYPHAGGAPHLIGKAFGARMERLSALLFLAVLPVGLPAALEIASGFAKAVWPLHSGGELLVQLATLAGLWLLGQRPARASGTLQALIALAIIASVALAWWLGDLPQAELPLLPPLAGQWQLLPAALAVMFWCFVGIEAFTHLGEEFRRPARDFPLALPHKLMTWGYEVGERETVSTALGDIETVHVVPRSPAQPGVLAAEVWYAPSLQWLPVRLRIVQDAETWVDLRLARAPEQG